MAIEGGSSGGSSADTADPAPVAVVTGAGSGVGRELALALAKTGWRLVLVGRRAERLAQTALLAQPAELAQPAAAIPPEAVHLVAADVGAPDSAQRIVSEALQRFGRIDALVNNAGLARFGTLDRVSEADVEAMVRTNFLGPLALIRAAAPELSRRQGCVVNVGSIGGMLALPGRATYGASKAALHHLTRSLARELAPRVRVNTVAPGALDTEIYDDLGFGPEETEALRAEMIRTTPLGRMGTPQDVVPWIELLLSRAGAWVTGSLLVIDGGRSC
ncbi:NAD(P)-dependent dehydrogenase (short-subunit alcohol dehydrogenase family) [Catenulispora sp. GP43]|uniref:SDR family NAD(P)-dependent oxidoreductase n=1 Tax=Catenulispora sp. GP43 TaxID=3156263 RepID=UPI0035121969